MEPANAQDNNLRNSRELIIKFCRLELTITRISQFKSLLLLFGSHTEAALS